MDSTKDPLRHKYNPDFSAEVKYLTQISEAFEKAERIQVTPTLFSLKEPEGSRVIQISSELADEISNVLKQIVLKIDYSWKGR